LATGFGRRMALVSLIGVALLGSAALTRAAGIEQIDLRVEGMT
jgi:hypothetical protein